MRPAIAVVLLFALPLSLPLPLPLSTSTSMSMSASAQERPGAFGAQSFVTAIELTVDVSDAAGKTPPDLTPADFIVREDGVERKVIAVDYLGGAVPETVPTTAAQAPEAAQPQPEQPVKAPWQTVIWFDAITTGRPLLHESVRDLKARAPELVAMGPVTVFYGDLKPRTVVSATRDAGELRSALDGMLKKLGSADRVEAIRREFLRDLEKEAMMRGQYLNTAVNMIGYYAGQETRLIHAARINMFRWLGRLPRQQPRMLLYVSDGFDLDPASFYNEQIRARTPVDPSTYHRQNLDMENETFARTLSTDGWVVVALGGTGGFDVSSNIEAGGTLGRSGGSAFLFHAPQAPLEQYARETGGVRVVHGGHLPAVLDRMRDRVRITYQVDRAPDVQPRKVAVQSRRPGLKIKAPGWSSSSSSVALMEVRALELLESPDRAAQGDLLLAAYAVPEDAKKKGERAGVLKVRVDLRPLQEVAKQIGATKVRFTVGFSDAEGLPSFSSHTVDAKSLVGVDELEWSIPYRLPRASDRASVVAEELSTGAWGSIRVPLDGTMAGRMPKGKAKR